MSAFTQAELDYLREHRLARIATVGSNGMPHVTPVGMWSHNTEHDTIDVTGRRFATTKKYRDVRKTGHAAIVIDDLVSTNPWHPRGIEVRGPAEAVAEPYPLIRISNESSPGASGNRDLWVPERPWPAVSAFQKHRRRLDAAPL